MKRLAILMTAAMLLCVAVTDAKERVINPYNIVDARPIPCSLDYDSTVKLLPRKFRPPAKKPHRCVILEMQLLMEGTAMTFTSLYFDRFSLTFDQVGQASKVQAVGVGVGPMPVKPGDPVETWTDKWEIGKAEGAFALGGSVDGKTSKIKVLFFVPSDVADVTLVQVDAGGELKVVKPGIHIE